jgi:hypothetical protein
MLDRGVAEYSLSYVASTPREFESCEDATVRVSLKISSQKNGNESQGCTRVVLGSLIAD